LVGVLYRSVHSGEENHMKGAGPLTTETTTSKDGTAIAYEKAGVGPALILIDAAGHYRRFSSFDGLRALLTADFTVYQFDSRGRGQSGDTAPFAPKREVEDLAALINVAGGSAFVYAFSSGGLVALQASRHGLPITRMALLEPPIAADEDRTAQRTFTAGLAELINAGRCSAAVEYYLVGIGVPADILDGMRGTDSWAAMEAVAPTLVYDCLISEATSYELTTLRAWQPRSPEECPTLPCSVWLGNGTESVMMSSRRR
jgi:pimeloyl-ACP methyl ester carboxylesterase